MDYGRLVTGSVFIGAGIAHLLAQVPLAAVVPGILPAHGALVQLSGITAIAGGCGLLWPIVQRWAAWGLVAWLVGVFPANLWMATHPAALPRIAPWLLWARLPFQLPMIWWVWRYTKTSRLQKDLAVI